MRILLVGLFLLVGFEIVLAADMPAKPLLQTCIHPRTGQRVSPGYIDKWCSYISPEGGCTRHMCSRCNSDGGWGTPYRC